MIGGDEGRVRATGADLRVARTWRSRPRRAPGREPGLPRPEEQGYLHCGGSGAGHFVKMVHNGIEYGLMAAYAEGFNLLHHADAGLVGRDQDAETAPLAHPEHLHVRARRGRRSPSSGGEGASSLPGCSTSRRTRCTTRRSSRGSPAACRTPARVAGRRWRPSRQALRRQCSRPRSTRASPRERRATSRTGSSRRCAPSSAGTPRSPRDRSRSRSPTTQPAAALRVAGADRRPRAGRGRGARRVHARAQPQRRARSRAWARRTCRGHA